MKTMSPKYPDGFLEENLARCRKETVCEGGCEVHEGDLQTVRVIDPNGTPHDWGYFAYCENAIKEDRERGMLVLLEGDEGFLPNRSVDDE